MPDALSDFRRRLPPEAGPCVQNEHTIPPPSVPHPSPMSGHRLSRCLIVIGWNERELARRTGRHQTQVRRWIKGESAISPPVAAWITDLADFVVAHPGPRPVSACPAKG
ncbi:hypothetical protein [Roseomonas mucosa]